MRLQRFSRIEPLFAQVTRPTVTIPGTAGNGIGRILFIVPPDLLLTDNASGIKLLNNSVDAVAVQDLSLRTGPTLKMMRDPTSSDKASATERTRNIGTAVGLGVQVLV